ncbi:RabGAP/TBC [Delitschia confertaspora ATCC 74209]|uniref:RabGAP/TBC n=1 Tax=Delitschia confertaspora ATCC 74209 TaxID=1513339 RepID=A0A9P4JKW9_9PLEO|nr:RabGAP/TBC [Delitschia confertaspora ATCC 74209]
MRSLAEAGKLWPQLDNFTSLTDLKIAVSSHKEPQITQGLRSVCWKIFLLFKSLDRSIWPIRLTESRTAYDSLRAQYLRAIKNPDEFESSVDPLSENQESPWVALRQDEELRAEIFQDIERCMPDNIYFRQPATQDMMLDVLFIFCKLHPKIGYRQGMHEILAPILWVVEREAVDPASIDSRVNGGSGLLTDLLDSRFIEHDSFTLFHLVMETAKTFYAPGDPDSGSPNKSPMLRRSKHIFETLLPKVDPKLAAHLTKLEIVPQIFLLRWIRLLFGREFPLDEVLDMWDALFAIDPSLELVNTICIAMLLRIRWQLLEADTNEAFTLLLKYPDPDAPAFTFIKDALYLGDHLTPEGGVEIISRYSKRIPTLEQSLLPASKPDRTRPSSPFSPKSLMPQQGSSGLEALFQGAAKGVLERGEKWGVGKVIRDAVGEVKKNVEALQANQGIARAGGREYRRPARVVAGTKLSGAQSGPAARRPSDPDPRSHGLAKMLQGAVSELWDYHKERSEKSGENKESLEALSLAIAKVQFVQVYLEDPSLPLPSEDTNDSTRPISPPERTASAPVLPRASTVRTGANQASSPLSVSPSDAKEEMGGQNPNSVSPGPSQQSQSFTQPPPNLPQPSQTLKLPQSSQAQSPPPTSTLPSRTRPLIAHSSFSWMLGEDSSSSDTRSSFASASAHSAFPADERRRMRNSGALGSKGFLFGEEEDGVLGESKEGWGKRRGSKAGIGKGPLGKAKGGVGAKGKGRDEDVEEEVIDLEDVGKGAVA